MFIFRSLLGRRRNSGFSVFLLIGGLFACVAGCGVAGFGVPYSLYRARQVANLPQPQPADLANVTPGTAILALAQLPADIPTNKTGLGLYYIESRPLNSSNSAEPDGATTSSSSSSSSSSSDWTMSEPPPPQTEFRLANGTMLIIQMPPKPSFLNAQRVVEEIPAAAERSSGNTGGEERRTIGFLPGQTLTVEGTWEGDNRLTAQTFYAGSPGDYIDYLTYTQPGSALFSGAFCGGLGLLLLVIGGGLRFFGR